MDHMELGLSVCLEYGAHYSTVSDDSVFEKETVSSQRKK